MSEKSEKQLEWKLIDDFLESECNSWDDFFRKREDCLESIKKLKSISNSGGAGDNNGKGN